jgi:hypothetical protein
LAGVMLWGIFALQDAALTACAPRRGCRSRTARSACSSWWDCRSSWPWGQPRDPIGMDRADGASAGAGQLAAAATGHRPARAAAPAPRAARRTCWPIHRPRLPLNALPADEPHGSTPHRDRGPGAARQTRTSTSRSSSPSRSRPWSTPSPRRWWQRAQLPPSDAPRWCTFSSAVSCCWSCRPWCS